MNILISKYKKQLGAKYIYSCIPLVFLKLLFFDLYDLKHFKLHLKHIDLVGIEIK